MRSTFWPSMCSSTTLNASRFACTSLMTATFTGGLRGHAPLTPDTYHLINNRTLSLMKPGAMLINTSRGALIDTQALIAALKSGHLGGAGLDVYEEEEGIFFHDLSDQIMSDDVFARLLTFRNVIVTGHQGFFTREALHDIAVATIDNISDFEAGSRNANVLTPTGTAQVA